MPELAKTILANNSNLLAYWKLESDSTDETANNNDGTDTSITYTTGKFGNAASFNSTSDKILVANEPSFDFDAAQAFSMGGWFYMNTAGVNRFLMGKQEASGNYAGYTLWQTSANVIDFTLSNNPSNLIEVTTPFSTTGAWTHIVATYNGTGSTSSVRIYINGKAAALTSVNNTLGANNILNNVQFEIGNRNGAFNFDGMIDDAFVFSSYVLSADQIKELYEGRIYGELRPNQFGTIQGLYHLSDTTDFSGNNNHLTNNGTTTFADGKLGNAADFGTSNSTKYLRVASAMSIDGGVITMGGWFKARAEIGSSSWIFCNQGNSNTKVTYRVTYDYNSGTRRLQFSRVRQGVAADTANYTITLGTSDWYHLGLSYDGTTVKGYVNGALVTSQASSGNGSGTTNSAVAIGAFEDGSGFASIYADEVFICSTALTANQIRQIYAYQKGLLGRYA